MGFQDIAELPKQMGDPAFYLRKEDLEMERTKRIIVILTLAIAFCFGLVSLAQAAGWKRWIPLWAKNNLENSQKAVSIPIWKITQNGTAESVQWIDHAPNTRFAIYDPNGDSDPYDLTTLSDDLVLDKETGLIWARDANTGGEKM